MPIRQDVIAHADFGRIPIDPITKRVQSCCFPPINFHLELTWWGRFWANESGGFPLATPDCYRECSSPVCDVFGVLSCPDESGCVNRFCLDDSCTERCVGGLPYCFQDIGFAQCRIDDRPACGIYCEGGIVKCIPLCSASCTDGMCPNGDSCDVDETCYACGNYDVECPDGYTVVGISGGVPTCIGGGDLVCFDSHKSCTGSGNCDEGICDGHCISSVSCSSLCDGDVICAVPRLVVLQVNIVWDGTIQLVNNDDSTVVLGDPTTEWQFIIGFGHAQLIVPFDEIIVSSGCCGDGVISACPMLIDVFLERVSWRVDYPIVPHGTWAWGVTLTQVNTDNPDEFCTPEMVWCHGFAFVDASDPAAYPPTLFMTVDSSGSPPYLQHIPHIGHTETPWDLPDDAEMTLLLGEDNPCETCQGAIQDYHYTITFYS